MENHLPGARNDSNGRNLLSGTVIERLGALGDGIVSVDGEEHFVPYALPGESVTVDARGKYWSLVSVDKPGPQRIAPVCPLFTRCGGCAMQHMDGQTYVGLKSLRLGQALRHAGLPDTVQPMIDAHGRGRRRVTFHARREGGRMPVGFMAARSHDLVEVAHCPVLVPELAGAPRIAAELAAVLAGASKPLDIQVTASLAGLDVDIRGHGPASDALRLRLGSVAEKLDLARLSLHGDLIVERRAPVQPMGRASVAPQPGGFLQATLAGEEAIAALVIAAIGKARRVADLFAGCGPLTFRLAEIARVHAVEGEAAALAALDRAARQTPGLKPVTTEARDLFRRPLLEPELDAFDAVVLDPPRAGAESQTRWLASSKVPLVVYVSCDVATFARDAAVLVAGGYVLVEVTPVDQFRYSAHVELVGLFRRAGRRQHQHSGEA